MSNNMVFLWAVTAVVWFATLGYMVSLVRKQSRMERELTAMEQTLREIDPSSRV